MTAKHGVSHEPFYHYYAQASQTPRTRQRFEAIRASVLRVLAQNGGPQGVLEVADIGCGAGTQSLLWAELGHRVHGLDVNEPLLELARKRAADAGCAIDVQVGSAVKLPWADESMDVCLLIELLEHVADWEPCLAECQRVLKPGGILFLTTSNKLCPAQQEFDLPLYSWYPRPLKRHFERLAVTTRPELVNHAAFPAVNWFTYYGLRKALRAGNFRCFDRFDMMDLSAKGSGARTIVSLIRSVAVLRWFAHVATEGTTIAGIKGAGASQ